MRKRGRDAVRVLLWLARSLAVNFLTPETDTNLSFFFLAYIAKHLPTPSRSYQKVKETNNTSRTHNEKNVRGTSHEA